MNQPVRDNAHILSAQQEFNDAYVRARQQFASIEGVAGVGFGLKEIGGTNSDDIAIVVFVREKKPDEEVPPGQRIPPVFDGYRTDVRVVARGSAEGCDNVTKYDKIQGGIQIMGKSDRANNGSYQGTLGCIVKRRHDRGRENEYLLTNKHVLYSPDFGAGEHVYHPTPSDENLGPVQEGLYGNVPYPVGVPGAETYFVDCAIARIDLDSRCCGSTCTKDTTEVSETLVVDLQVNGVNSLSDVRSVIDDVTIIHTTANPRKVFKVGRKTGRTTGKVVLVGAPLDADPEPDKVGGPRIAAKNTIMVEFDVTSSPTGLNCHGNARFTEGGDSGSVVVDEDGRVIGLHSHGGGAPGSSGLVASHACHILPVLDHLGICIPVTTGTSHGTSRAADGSGVEPAVLGDFVIPDGEIVFTAQTDRAALSSPPGFPDPEPLADEEIRHMRVLLDTLRSTSEGRELHDLFGRLRREVGYLIRNNRPVKVVWHRNKGPAFMAHVLNHLKGRTEHIPLEVDGVAAATLLERMATVLSVHGSNPLREAIEQHRDGLLQMVAGGGPHVSVHDITDQLRQRAMS